MKIPSDISANDRPEGLLVFRGDYYTEGPAVDGDGNLFFTTLAGGKIVKIDARGHSSVWAESSCPNGQRILSNGDHLVCDSREGKVIRFDASGKKTGDAASGECGGMTIRTPNDLAIDEDAGFYFTDSVRETGAVFFFGKDGSKRVVARNLDYPNGICLSKNKKILFVAESYRNRILAIELKDEGVAKDVPQCFCSLPQNPADPVTGNLPDGILLDSEDKLWVAHYGMGSVHVIASGGNLLHTWPTGIPLTSNIFLTADKKLIVTGGSGEPGPGFVHVLMFPDT